MTGPRRIAVLDVGKTNVKLAVIDLMRLAEMGVLATLNPVRPGPPYPHYDVERIWAFLLDGLAELHDAHGIDAVTVAAHGAAAALLDPDGALAAPVLDYEHDGPDALAAAYDALRPDFAESGTPRLPAGLNLGAQLHWQLATVPGLRDRLAQVVTYPQYWVHRLTGVAATEVTSLGCHTDLWRPAEGGFSGLVDRLGLAERMAPVRRAIERIGPLGPKIAARTGLAPGTPVQCGVHDSNASLYPHLLHETPPFAVVSTGTWVISMAVGGAAPAAAPERDLLVNVNAHGQPVPSARFMGGREYEVAIGSAAPGWAEADLAAVLSRGVMLMPSLVAGSGPYAGRTGDWVVAPVTAGERHVAVSVYLALMTSVCLSLAGARGPALVEGPFARNTLYLRMLATATGRPVHAAGTAVTGTRLGAALLVAPDAGARLSRSGEAVAPLGPDAAAYAAAWRDRLAPEP